VQPLKREVLHGQQVVQVKNESNSDLGKNKSVGENIRALEKKKGNEEGKREGLFY